MTPPSRQVFDPPALKRKGPRAQRGPEPLEYHTRVEGGSIVVTFTLAVATVLLAFAGLGVWGARRVRSGSDFTVAGRSASAPAVVGILLGALVGGASTVGTAQLAYTSGLSALWFTLGGGLGCLLLGWGFAAPLRRFGVETLIQLLEERYGRKTALTALAASFLGTFLSVVAQFLSGAALLASVLPLPPALAVGGTALLVLAFIALGGLRSYGTLGQAKILLLYGVLAFCALAAHSQGATPTFLWKSLPLFPWFHPLGRGLGVDLGACVSLVVGVFCTQIYLQSLFAARDEATARRGALWSALLMPPLGLLGVWVGLSVRAWGVDIDPALALPWFLLHSFSPGVAGLLWGILFITVVGCAAGLSLGMGTNLARDLLPALGWNGKGTDGRGEIRALRLSVLGVVAAAAALGARSGGSLILQWSYLSMGLRGAGTFFPLVLGVLAPGRLPPPWALASALAGLGGTLLWPLTGQQGEPLFLGLALSGAFCLAGFWAGRRGQRL